MESETDMYGLCKLAALNEDVKLYPHQERAVNKPGEAIVLADTVGSDKTKISKISFYITY